MPYGQNQSLTHVHKIDFSRYVTLFSQGNGLRKKSSEPHFTVANYYSTGALNRCASLTKSRALYTCVEAATVGLLHVFLYDSGKRCYTLKVLETQFAVTVFPWYRSAQRLCFSGRSLWFTLVHEIDLSEFVKPPFFQYGKMSVRKNQTKDLFYSWQASIVL